MPFLSLICKSSAEIAPSGFSSTIKRARNLLFLLNGDLAFLFFLCKYSGCYYPVTTSSRFLVQRTHRGITAFHHRETTLLFPIHFKIRLDTSFVMVVAVNVSFFAVQHLVTSPNSTILFFHSRANNMD